MIIKKFIQKKIIRFLNSKKILKIFFYYHKFFNNKGLKNIGFDFTLKKNRKYIVQDIINLKNYSKYLEIGCFDDELFKVIKIADKTGVDPVSGGTIRLTSDQFFLQNKKFFDCVFIDGLHTYDQCSKDCINAMKFLDTNGLIILHDMLPRSKTEETQKFSGDAWKVAVDLSKSENLEFIIANIDQGVGLIKTKENSKYIFISLLKK